MTRRHRFVALAVSRLDGKILWQRTLTTQLPHEGGHNTGSFASNSPATDGEHLFAFFGSRGLYALGLDGKLKWKADLGKMQTKHAHGEGSSPALYDDTLIVNWDHEGESSVMAVDKKYRRTALGGAARRGHFVGEPHRRRAPGATHRSSSAVPGACVATIFRPAR